MNEGHFSKMWVNCYQASYHRKQLINVVYLIPQAALGPGVFSASNRKEYHKHKNNNVSGE
jgi:hypothetical protein